MGAILGFLKSMMPYALAAMPVYGFARFFYCKARKVRVNRYRETALFVFVIFLAALASQTILPEFEFSAAGIALAGTGHHETNLIPLHVFVQTYTEVFVRGNINALLINFLGNVVLFIPLGIFIPLLWKTPAKKTVLIGFCSSLLIEISQLLLPRVSDVDDLLLNTVGVWLGTLIFLFLKKHFEPFVRSFDQDTPPAHRKYRQCYIWLRRCNALVLDFPRSTLYNTITTISQRCTMEFKEKLVNLRKERKLSQEQLAEKLGVSRQAVSRWESGDTTPDMMNILGLCDIFEVSADDLIRGGEQAKGCTESPAGTGLSRPARGQKNHFRLILAAIFQAAVSLSVVGICFSDSAVQHLLCFVSLCIFSGLTSYQLVRYGRECASR